LSMFEEKGLQRQIKNGGERGATLGKRALSYPWEQLAQGQWWGKFKGRWQVASSPNLRAGGGGGNGFCLRRRVKKTKHGSRVSIATKRMNKLSPKKVAAPEFPWESRGD